MEIKYAEFPHFNILGGATYFAQLGSQTPTKRNKEKKKEMIDMQIQTQKS